MRIPRRAALAVVAALAAAAAAPGAARAADWCGSVATTDRPAVLAGNPVRVVYAVPADGADRSAELAPRISADVDEIDAWWRRNDSGRTIRFDVTPFPCGLQVDLGLKRLALPASEYLSKETRWDRIFDDLEASAFEGTFTKYLVYYDGPVDDPRLCGQGGGFPSGGGIAVIYLHACTSISSASTAAHELLHTFGALEGATAPNACPDDAMHVCDSTGDVLYPFAQYAPLSSLVLDLNRDDYYGHTHAWFDARDSAWLRHLDAQVPLSVVVRGRGVVRSDAPGVDCAAACRSEWNAGSAVVLTAAPAAGQRFVRWTGGCAFADVASCALTLDGARELTALFAPARFRLTLSVTGRGRVTGGASCAAARCVRQVVSHEPLTLRARAAKGWRFRSWVGSCRGTRPTCRLPMKKASSARAVFVRRG